MARANLAHLFKSLHLSSPEKYNVYLVGSRLWGTNTDTSDWDLLVVGDVSSAQLTSLHKSQYDISLLDRQEFAERVKEGSIIEVICALMRREDMFQCAFDTNNLQVDPEAVRTWLETRQAKDLVKAEKFWLKGNRQSAWKILRHILHGQALYNYLVGALRENQITLSVNDVQTILRPATLLCDKAWMQLDWADVHVSLNNALSSL